MVTSIHAVTVARVVDTAALRRSLERLHSRIHVTVADGLPGPEGCCDQCTDAGCPPAVYIEWLPRPGGYGPDVNAAVGADCAWRYLADEVLPYLTTESPVVEVHIQRWTW